MAEKLKVFVNKTFTSADLVNGDEWPLVVTDATTQAVVKSIEIPKDMSVLNYKGKPVPVSLLHNDFPLGTAESMEGHEIIDVNSELKYKLPSVPTISYLDAGETGIFAFTSTEQVDFTVTTDYTKFATSFYGLTRPGDDVLEDYINIPNQNIANYGAVPAMSYPTWFFSTGTKAVYFSHDGNSNTKLYSAYVNGTSVSAWSIVDSNTYAYKCLDTEGSKVYWVRGRTVYEYNIDAGTTINKGQHSIAPNTNTYTCAGFCNGILFWVANSDNEYKFFYWKQDTEEFGMINASQKFEIHSDSSIGIAYNPDEDMYYIDAGYSTVRAIYSLSGSFSDSSDASYIGGRDMYENDFYAGAGYVNGDRFGNMYIYNSVAIPEVHKFEKDQATLIDSYPSLGAVIGDAGWFKYTKGPIIKIPIDFVDADISLQCKVSGIEITEVV